MLRFWRELRDAKRKGRRDGRAGVPGVEQDTLPFDLLEIQARAQERAELVLSRWRGRERQLGSELDDLTRRAVEAEARLAAAEQHRDAAQAEHERRTIDEDERLARLQTQLEDLHGPVAAGSHLPAPTPIDTGKRSRPEPVRSAPGDDRSVASADVSWRGIAPFVYWPLIALIVIGEIPLNAFAFRLFHEPDVLTYAMTVTVAIGLVVFAHAVGLLLARPERTRVQRILVGVLVALPTAAIGVISLVRFGYLIDVGVDAGIGPLLGTLAFGLINLLVFGAAAGLSYLHHDPRTLVNRRASARAAEREHAREERRCEKRDRRRREGERAIRKERHEADIEVRGRESRLRREQIAGSMHVIREAARERLEHLAQLGGQVDAARVALGEARSAVQAVATRRRALRETTDAELRAIRAHRDRLVFAYCSANVRARAGHVTPACLRDVPSLELPAEFREPIARAA
ncbi:MAG: hypothetical protein L0206_13295 [Actinobacteria bacterium]|nr:hypothetical protein [Actinomycetota bacterium]